MTTLKKIISNLIHFFITPFSQHFLFYFVILILQLCYTISLWKLNDFSHFPFIHAFSSLGISYLVTLPLGIIKSRFFQKTYITVSLILCVSITILEVFCAFEIKENLYPTHLYLILATSVSEARGFISKFATANSILILIALILACYLIAKKLKHIYLPTKIAIPAALLSILSVIIIMWIPLLSDTGLGNGIWCIYEVSKFKKYDLKKTQAKPDIIEIAPSHPNIILIIGESFDRLHSSLYGYDKDTNPKLTQRLLNDSLHGKLFLMDSVRSAAPMTLPSFHVMFTEASDIDDPNWQNSIFLPTALKEGGYQTYWLSNQSTVTMVENTLGEIYALCDTVYCSFVTHQTSSYHYDEVLLPVFNSFVHEQSDKPKFIAIHLIGSHGPYSNTYPKEFNYFTPNDYDNRPEVQRLEMSMYDNSIRYNDHILDTIFSLADSIPAIVVMVPDHGQDIFYTRTDVTMHGRRTIPESFEAACRIPFMVYLTKSYMDTMKTDKITASLIKRKHDEYITSGLIYTILELAGLELKGGRVAKGSFFKGDLINDKDSCPN